MKWQATALINYAAEQHLDAVRLNSLTYLKALMTRT